MESGFGKPMSKTKRTALFVSFSITGPTRARERSAAQSVADIASSVALEPKFTRPVSDPTSFEDIYKAAEIPPAPQGYSILKVSQILESEHIRNLPSDVKKSSVLVALDAAGVDIKRS